ncbi:MAG: septum site-determining protein MinC [Acetatifactor sp.]|nr:septum site-determining protein MinC [Acetatifactor sp.]
MENVVIKSFQNGITLLINVDSDIDDVVKEVSLKFSEANKFFGNSKMAISFEGKVLNDDQKKEIINAINKSCDMKIVCICEKDREKNREFSRALAKVDSIASPEDVATVYRGSIVNNDKIELKNSLVVVGSVNPGCEICSEGNIIVLGGLYGIAIAGNESEGDGHFIFALEMEPEYMEVDGRKISLQKPSKWPIKAKVLPKIAYLKDGRGVIENYSGEKAAMFDFYKD